MKVVWEYRVLSVLDSWLNADLNASLDRHGDEGWEIICLLPEPPGLRDGEASGSLRFLAKREAPVESS